MGLSPSRGGPLPASAHPPLLQSLRPHPARRGQQNGGRSSRPEPLRGSPSARPLDHARSRRREESGPSRGSRRRAATAAPQKRPAIIYEASPRGALNQASFPVAILAPPQCTLNY
ncbi:hypothetical protein NDU88_001932 [Pleurodeles waltl]|uniref:Uncharacterized protein n=1 Tax=Pleurodeles waltl TaxID=8319 RepID=A0AAV7TLL1_PLEWA|nr:hypothetical protein NDU88_001932 [Pleurodeles waltl]